eukprot:761971-Hanusia_phi.AAC.4
MATEERNKKALCHGIVSQDQDNRGDLTCVSSAMGENDLRNDRSSGPRTFLDSTERISSRPCAVSSAERPVCELGIEDKS